MFLILLCVTHLCNFYVLGQAFFIFNNTYIILIFVKNKLSFKPLTFFYLNPTLYTLVDDENDKKTIFNSFVKNESRGSYTFFKKIYCILVRL